MPPEEIRRQIADNLAAIQSRIETACAASGRNPVEIHLVAVVKYAELAWVRELVSLGITTLAESRPQQLVERVPLFPSSLHWHMIGHLQTNKVRRVLPLVERIHAVDTLKLLQTIDRIAVEEHLSPQILLEVNVSGEAAKQGFTPTELQAVWNDAISSLQRTTVRGLMTMAPNTENLDDARRTFTGLRRLRDDLQSRGPIALPELSMGMTHDFEVAIQAGATHIRLGSALFDGLN